MDPTTDRETLSTSASSMRQYIRAHRREYKAFYSDLIESFFLLSKLSYVLVSVLFLSNVSNFLRTRNSLSLIVNLPSIVMLLIYPFLRKRNWIPSGQGTRFCSILLILISIQWCFSIWVYSKHGLELLPSSMFTMLILAFWMLALGPSIARNSLKALLASSIIITFMMVLDSAFVAKISPALILGGLVGICMNQVIDQMLRFRFFVEQQGKLIFLKNAEMRVMMRSAPIILLTFKAGGRVEVRRTEFSQKFLPNADTTLEEFLSISSFNPAEKNAIKSALDAMLGEDAISFALNESALPVSLELLSRVGEPRSFIGTYAPVTTSDGGIGSVLLVAHDTTEMKNQQQLHKTASLESDSLLALIRTPRHLLDVFLAECRILKTIVSSDELARADKVALKMRLHTFKGNARTLGFTALSQLVHELEGTLKAENFELGFLQLADILSLLINVHMERFNPGLAATSLADYTSHLLTMACEKVSDLVHKPVARIQVECVEAANSATIRDLCFQIFPHLVANSMDHGISDPDTRAAEGRPREGTIFCKIDQIGSGPCVVEFHDDGKGIAIARLRSLLEKNHSGTTYTDEEIASFALLPEISTASRVTKVSGRGVGLSAVAQAVKQIGGSIELLLTGPDQGGFRPFTIQIQVPAAQSAILLQSA